MANISTYPLGTPGAGDLIPGTQKFTDANGETKNLTKNFTVSQVAAFANSTAAYTTYVARLDCTAGNPPTVTTLYQNTTGLTITWTRTGSGEYLGTFSSDIAEIEFWATGQRKTPGMIDVLWLSTTTMRINSWTTSSGAALDELTSAYIEVRVYS